MKTLTKIQQCALALGFGLAFMAPGLLHPLWSRFAGDLSAQDYVQQEKIIHILQVVIALLGWVGLTSAAKKWGKHELHKTHHVVMSLCMSSIVVITAFQLSSSKETVDRVELNSWISTYDPFLSPEEDRPAFTYIKADTYVSARSLQKSSSTKLVSDAATAGAAKYNQDNQPFLMRDHWLALALRDGLLSLDQIDQDRILSITAGLKEDLSKERSRYPGVVMPTYDFKEARFQTQLAVGSKILSKRDREQLAEKLLAGITWEVRGEGPEEWLKRKEGKKPSPISLRSIRAAVDALIALDSTEALDASSELVMEALLNNYRPTDDSGVAGFLPFAARDEDTSEEYLGSVNNADADAIFLMGIFGFPESVDIPALHKHYINESTDYPHSDGCHRPDTYLAAALRFHLEELYPEL